jgi:hypothetical protein
MNNKFFNCSFDSFVIYIHCIKVCELRFIIYIYQHWRETSQSLILFMSFIYSLSNDALLD